MAAVERHGGRVTPDTQRAVEELAGRALDGTLVGPFRVGVDTPEVGIRGVYIVLDLEGRCAYVGRAFSLLDSQRVRQRIAEHTGNLAKRDAFASYYVLPLKCSTRERQVEVVEGWVARHMRPYMGSLHPNPLRRT